jgi:putative nucleotidyltransferase-like protein
MTLDLPPSLWSTLHRLAAGEGWPPSSAATAERFVGRASKEALLPLLFADRELPPVVQEALNGSRALRRISALRSDLLLAAARQLDEILAHEPHVFLKGVDYQHRLYPQPSLRPMQDIDILVPRARVPAVMQRLQAHGLAPIPMATVTEVPSHHERLFRLGDISVDVHHSFVQRARNRIDYEAVWDRKVPLAAPGLAAYRLADADALVYHAVSMAADEFSIPLLRYLDLWLMLRKVPGIHEAARERAREWGVDRALYGAFRLGSRLFPELEAVIGRTTDRLLAPLARRFLDDRVLPNPWEHGDGRTPARGTRVWRKLWLIDGFRHRAAFTLYHAYALVRGQLIVARRRAHPPTGGAANTPSSG